MEKIKENNPNTTKFWNQRYSKSSSRENLWIHNVIANYLSKSLGRVLELGCGDGTMIRALREKYPGPDYVGVDFSNVAIEKARAKGIGRFFCEDIHNLTENGGYDLVVCIQSLEHVNDPGLIAKRMLNACRGGGYVIITVPKLDCVADCDEHVNRICGDDLKKWLGPGTEVVEMLGVTKLVAIQRKDNQITASKYKTACICAVDDELIRKTNIWPEPVHSWTEWTRIVPFDAFYGSVITEKTAKLFEPYDIIVLIANPLRCNPLLKFFYKFFPEKKIGIRNDSALMSLFKNDSRHWPLFEFMELVRKADFLMFDRPGAEGFWKAYFPELGEKCHFVGIPIDLDDYRLYRQAEKDENKVFIIGDHLCTSAAALVHKVHPEAVCEVIDYRLGTSSKLIQQFPNWTLYKKGDQRYFLNIAKSCKYAVYFDTMGSAGRAPRDMAALGIPCFGHACTGYQKELFPFTTIDRWEDLYLMPDKIGLLRKSSHFYDKCLERADREIQKYNIRPSKARYYEAIEKIMEN